MVLAVTAIMVLATGCTGTAPAAAGPAPATPAMPQPVSIANTPVQYKDVNGVRLAYWEWGSGEPVLLIEGFSSEVANDTHHVGPVERDIPFDPLLEIPCLCLRSPGNGVQQHEQCHPHDPHLCR